jgi:hypothetical protein
MFFVTDRNNPSPLRLGFTYAFVITPPSNLGNRSVEAGESPISVLVCLTYGPSIPLVFRSGFYLAPQVLKLALLLLPTECDRDVNQNVHEILGHQ